MTDCSAMTDAEFMLWYLRQAPATTMQIIRASEGYRDGQGLTPHSRVTDLRRKLLAEGLTVEVTRLPKKAGERKARFLYAIVPLVVIEAGGQVALAV